MAAQADAHESMRERRSTARRPQGIAAALRRSPTLVRRAVLARGAAAEAVTPALIEAAQKEGKVVYYTSVDLPLAEKIAQGVRGEISGHRRAGRAHRRRARVPAHRPGVRQQHPRGRRGQSSDAAHFIVWKRNGMLAPYVPEDVAKHYPAEHKDPDGHVRELPRLSLRRWRYNTDLVKAEDAPKSFADLLDPKWTGKIVKAHPGYSGTILTATFQIVARHRLGLFREARQQKIMQVQSASDPPKKLALGERAIMADGIEYGMLPAQGDRQAGRAGLSGRRHAADHRAERASSRARRTRTRRGCSRTTCCRRSASSSSSTSAGCARRMRWSRTSPAASR